MNYNTYNFSNNEETFNSFEKEESGLSGSSSNKNLNNGKDENQIENQTLIEVINLISNEFSNLGNILIILNHINHKT